MFTNAFNLVICNQGLAQDHPTSGHPQGRPTAHLLTKLTNYIFSISCFNFSIKWNSLQTIVPTCCFEDGHDPEWHAAEDGGQNGHQEMIRSLVLWDLLWCDVDDARRRLPGLNHHMTLRGHHNDGSRRHGLLVRGRCHKRLRIVKRRHAPFLLCVLARRHNGVRNWVE